MTFKVGGMAANNEILTSREAQKLLKIGRTKLWALTKNGNLPAYRIGQGPTSALRYKRVELLQWLENNRLVLNKDKSA
ncbi:MAG: helix-turn-helix domain-containing protein [Acidobacteriota bacterium]